MQRDSSGTKGKGKLPKLDGARPWLRGIGFRSGVGKYGELSSVAFGQDCPREGTGHLGRDQGRAG